jgi:DNA-binding protein H-NS
MRGATSSAFIKMFALPLLRVQIQFRLYLCTEETMARQNLSGMDVHALMELREQVNKRLLQHRGELQRQLDRLDTEGFSRAGRRRTSPLNGMKVAPKYRGPSGETWAGRGMRPRWLVAEMKGGKKLDAFLIDKASRKQRTKRKHSR